MHIRLISTPSPQAANYAEDLLQLLSLFNTLISIGRNIVGLFSDAVGFFQEMKAD